MSWLYFASLSDRASEPGVVPIRVGVGDPESLVETPRARDIAAAFAGSGWRFSLVASRDGAELWARAERD